MTCHSNEVEAMSSSTLSTRSTIMTMGAVIYACCKYRGEKYIRIVIMIRASKKKKREKME